MRKIGLLHKPIFHILLIAITGILIYSNTFHVPFHFDDTGNIVENYKLRNLGKLWPPSGSRWFGFWAFALNYKLGGFNVTTYHIVNLIIHILNAILVYYLVVLTFKTPYFSPPFNSPLKGGYRGVALFSALLFASHPIQTQAVTYIVQRFTSLATMFYLLSLVMYIKWRLKIEQQTSRAADHQEKRKNYYTVALLLYCASLISAILAMKTKEIAFTLPVIITLYEFMFFDGKIKKRILYLTPILLTMLIIPLSLIGIDKPIGDVIGELREAAKETEEIPRWSYLFTQFRVISTYIRLLFLPINQNLDYDYEIYNSFLESDMILSFLFLLLIFGLGIYLIYRSWQNPPIPPLIPHLVRGDIEGSKGDEGRFPNFRLISFGIFWFFITLSVESSIIPIRDVIFEHRAYLPFIGFIIAIVSAIGLIKSRTENRICFENTISPSPSPPPLEGGGWGRGNFHSPLCRLVGMRVSPENPPIPPLLKGGEGGLSSLSFVLMCNMSISSVKKAVVPLLFLIIITLSVTTYARNTIWQDEVRLWKDAVKKSPDKPRPHNNLGNAYSEQERMNDAIKEFQIALMLNPDDAIAHNNLGHIYYKQGRIDEALKKFLIALSLKSDYPDAYYNLGNAYFKQGRLNEAIQKFRDALMLNPYLVEAHNNLGSVYYSQGRTNEAIQEFETALSMDPDYAEAHHNLGLTYSKQGLLDKAFNEYIKALKTNPDYAEAHYNLGNLYTKKGVLSEAIREYSTVVSLKPDYDIAHHNLALAYFIMGNREATLREYDILKTLNPALADKLFTIVGHSHKGGNPGTKKSGFPLPQE